VRKSINFKVSRRRVLKDIESMKEEVRILILEDVPADAELMERELHKGGIEFSAKRVETKETFLKELKDFVPDLILADLTLPTFNGIAALAIVQERYPDIPFIFVSGTIGEELAIETLKRGAADYVLKDRLSRLVPAVNRALREGEERVILKRTEEEREKLIHELQEALAKVKTLSGMLPICASCKNIRDDKGYWNQIESYIRDHSEAEFSHSICPDCKKKLYGDV
jgi:DNA-binding NtrC family response regulator